MMNQVEENLNSVAENYSKRQRALIRFQFGIMTVLFTASLTLFYFKSFIISAVSLIIINLAGFLLTAWVYKQNSSFIKFMKKRKELEQGLNKKLQEYKAEVSSFFHSPLYEVYLFDSETFKFTHVNKAAQDNLGYSLEELQNMTPVDLKPGISEEEIQKMFQGLLAGTQAFYKFKTTHTRKDGTTYPIQAFLQLTMHEERQSFQALILDRSEEEHLNKKVIQASKLSSIGELSAGVGHEINNPLTVAMGQSERLTNYLFKFEILDNEIIAILDKQKVAHDRIRKIVEGLRVFSRVNEKEKDFTKFSLNNAIRDTIHFFGEFYQKHGIKIEIDIPNNDIHILGSYGALQQVLSNLISNARDALEKTGNPIIQITLNQVEGFAEIRVEDNGEGIDEKDKSKILESFYTTKEIGKGTGLGLSISNQLVEDMKGSLSYESQKDKGTCFKILFPIVEANKEITKKKSGLDINRLKDDSQVNILVVDDEEDIRELVSEILKDADYNTMEARDGLDALNVIENNKVDILVSDIKMPRMNGFELFKTLNEKYGNKKPQIIALTGGISPDSGADLKEILDKHVSSFLYKPFTDKDLIDSINKVLKSEN